MTAMQWKESSFRRLTEEDIPLVYEVFQGNPLYFLHCPPEPTCETIRQDMAALPPQKSEEDKWYGGLFAGERLIAVLDLIQDYPKERTLFIGFFMLCKEEQGHGLGTEIISALCRESHKRGFTQIRLGYVKGNPQSQAFWQKNRFHETGIEAQTEKYTVVVMERELE